MTASRRVEYSVSDVTALDVARGVLVRARDRYQDQVDRLDEAIEMIDAELSREPQNGSARSRPAGAGDQK